MADVVLMDFEMPGTNGLEGLALIGKISFRRDHAAV
jgi:DNA-binding NarL/FixJ family response regulator